MRVSKKRALLAGSGVLGVAAIALIATGSTFGFFSASATSGTNVFSAGTLGLGSASVSHCTVSTIVPLTSGTCTVTVKTSGSIPADVAIDVSVKGTAASPPPSPGYGCSGFGAGKIPKGLFNGVGTTTTGLQITLKSHGEHGGSPTDNVSSYTLSALTGSTSSVTDLLTGTNVAPTTSETYTLSWSMPNYGCASNLFQGTKSTFTFTVHSVQWKNNHTAATFTNGQKNTTISWS